MKKFLTLIIIFLLAMIVLKASGSHDMAWHWDGDDFDGPFDLLFGLLFAGGGLLIAAVVLACVALFAGVMIAGGIGLCMLLVALFTAPLLLPLLIPLAILWLVVSRNRKRSAAYKQTV